MAEDMTPANAKVDDLRRTIDKIDAEIHKLLMDRAAIVEALGALKRSGNGDGGYFRPGREAVILRRLAARHQGPLPVDAVLAIWRPLVTAYLRLQWPLTVITTADAETRDLARRHFGAATPLRPVATPDDALAALNEGPAVAVLPDVTQGQWWLNPALLSPTGPRIVARLPFFGEAANPAYILAAGMPDESGDDLTLIVLKDLADGQDWVRAAAGMGLELLPHATYKARDGRTSVLAAAASTPTDAWIAALAGVVGGTVHVVGGYARPLVLPRP